MSSPTSSHASVPAPVPFHIDVPEAELDELRRRLDATRWPAGLPGTGWTRGTPVEHAKELAAYWRSEFDWRAQERRLNALPQFTTVLDGQSVHFAHIRSDDPGALPLVLLHGWPMSFVEFLEVVEPLRKDFHLVIPSIPGFAFSSPLAEPGWTAGRVAGAFTRLMEILGYDRYGVHGGDTGAFVAPEMGRLAPGRVTGVHLTGILSFPAGDEEEDARLTDVERERAAALDEATAGYVAIQARSPQTLAYGLTDSPAAQLAWIAEMFHRWAGGPVDRDLFLTNVTLYWLTGTAGSAAQIYYEQVNDPAGWEPRPRGTVPTGVLLAGTNEYGIRPYAERDHAIVRWSQQDTGGHFLAMEEPGVFAEDVRAFFRALT
ncbi:epoxide hydrolase [Nonomuraea sp. 3-1Str]|uniref:epoxide hydrolase family protein n=1 Tax=Nonomuraea sp. 3-1Str TaxID=2929801 RepID=UPI002866FDC4|nr:epoxide hydrolase [Nonomuraea sp. 3-1Str]MDR8412649.1 epoxide hydrolase [Nonomuraea sp. 3-1Str]